MFYVQKQGSFIFLNFMTDDLSLEKRCGGGERRREEAPPACRMGKNPLQLTALLERVYWRRRRDGRQKVVRKKLEGNGLFSFSNL